MSSSIKRIENAGRLLGIDLRRGAVNLVGLGRFFAQRRQLVEQAARSEEHVFPMGKLYPCLGDDVDSAGTAAGQYFHQDLFVAQEVFRRRPKLHVDVGSRVDGFVSHVACFREIEVFDIRQLRTSASNIRFLQCDAMKPGALPKAYADSVSCLHALEHFGLGRYGDPIDYDGHLRGFANLVDLVEPGGVLYLSVPIGPQRIEFNGHRVFSVAYLQDLAQRSKLTPISFSYVDDGGELHTEVPLRAGDTAVNYGCTFGCGIFVFRKP